MLAAGGGLGAHLPRFSLGGVADSRDRPDGGSGTALQLRGADGLVADPLNTNQVRSCNVVAKYVADKRATPS